MTIINLRKYYYPQYKTDTFIEVSEEVAEALLLAHRYESNSHQKMAHAELFLRRLEQALSCLTPPQARVFMLTSFLASGTPKLPVRNSYPTLASSGQSREQSDDYNDISNNKNGRIFTYETTI